MQGKYKMGFLIGICTVIIVIGGFSWIQKERPVIYINEEPVYEKEFTFLSQTANPYDSYMDRKIMDSVKNVENHNLEEEALKRVLIIKIEQMMLKSNNILKDISYEEFTQKVDFTAEVAFDIK